MISMVGGVGISNPTKVLVAGWLVLDAESILEFNNQRIMCPISLLKITESYWVVTTKHSGLPYLIDCGRLSVDC